MYPDYMTARPCWCLWRLEWEDNRWKKKPYQVSGQTAKSNDPATWGTFVDVSTQFLIAGGYDGLGFFMDPERNGLAFVDLDHCIQPDGSLSELASTVMQLFEGKDVYREVSQSGTGLHILCKGTVPRSVKRTDVGIELYSSGRFVALTGNGEGEPGEAQDVLDILYQRYKKEPKTAPQRERLPRTAGRRMTDDQIVAKCRTEKSGERFTALYDRGDWQGAGLPSPSEADAWLCTKLAFWTDRDPEQVDRIFRASGLYREKWEREDYRDSTINGACAVVEESRSEWQDRKSREEWGGIFEQPRVVDHVLQLDLLHNYQLRQLDDVAAGRLYAEVFRSKLRFNVDGKAWMVFDGQRWSSDTSGGAAVLAGQMLARALGEAIYRNRETADDEGLKKFLAKIQRTDARRRMIADAQPYMEAHHSDFDRDPYLLNVRNGVLDLRTGELAPHEPGQMLSKLCNVAFDREADGTAWESFIDQIMEGDAGKIQYLRQLCGYCLTGTNTLERLFMFYGPTTRNGKDTLIGTLQYLLGSYAASLNPESLSRSKFKDGAAASPDFARLVGVRFVHVSEAPQGMTFDAALVKRLTGRGTIAARELYGKQFEFVPEFKMVLNTNHLPSSTDRTLFTSDRVDVLPFTRHFSETERDPGLKERLRRPENLSAALNWCLEGLRDFQQNGGRLQTPDAVRQATEEYAVSNDRVRNWMQERLEPAEGQNVAASAAYLSYRQWHFEAGTAPEGKKRFFEELRARGLLMGTGTVNGKTVYNVISGYRILPQIAETA